MRIYRIIQPEPMIRGDRDITASVFLERIDDGAARALAARTQVCMPRFGGWQNALVRADHAAGPHVSDGCLADFDAQ